MSVYRPVSCDKSPGLLGMILIVRLLTVLGRFVNYVECSLQTHLVWGSPARGENEQRKERESAWQGRESDWKKGRNQHGKGDNQPGKEKESAWQGKEPAQEREGISVAKRRNQLGKGDNQPGKEKKLAWQENNQPGEEEKRKRKKKSLARKTTSLRNRKIQPARETIIPGKRRL